MIYLDDGDVRLYLGDALVCSNCRCSTKGDDMESIDWQPWLVVGAVLLALIAGWFLHAALGDD